MSSLRIEPTLKIERTLKIAGGLFQIVGTPRGILFCTAADHDFVIAIHRAASNQTAAFPFMGSSGIWMQCENCKRPRDLALKAPARQRQGELR
jgi:hypothetical protein